MASASTTMNSELPRQSSICSLSTFIADLHNHNHHHHHHSNAAEDHGGDDDEASSMDDLLKNIYSDSPQPDQGPPVGVDEVWKRIVAGDGDRSGGDGGGAMTLEDFLTKNGAVREEDVRATVEGGGGGFGQFHGAPVVVYGGATAGAGRGKRRAVEDPPLDKATQQKQRRMIKNRESAARSRERKQAYTIELETLVAQLEEENALLLKDEAERNQERYKQLMEHLVPVVESKEKKQKTEMLLNPETEMKREKVTDNLVVEAGKNVTRVVLRRVSSMEW